MMKARQHSDQEKINSMLGESGEPSKGFHFPAQALFLINSFLAFVIVYANKVVLSVAIVAMSAEPTQPELSTPAAAAAVDSAGNGTTAQPDIADLLHSSRVPMDHATKSAILGAFFTGYIVSQVPAGRMAERFGAKWLLGISMLVCSLISVLIPAAVLEEPRWLAERDGCWAAAYAWAYGLIGPAAGLQILRSLQGFCAGVAHPCMHALITRWTPRTQRSMTAAFIYSGSQIGTVIIMPVTGFLSSTTFMGECCSRRIACASHHLCSGPGQV